ncbi:RDD family protein [Steroidobacter sp.]|uniref:RDD family protein n=1 Tax=Steroidobacter sp. TaxID=1978227 RepID=UPI001A6485B0|nr:RDD family protein [Steroidobacter sp.]MBL8266214.1 RDD family protein [Steroidobacter sp.]
MAAPQVTLQSITGVDVELRIAGVGSRSYAFVVDWHIRLILAFSWWSVGSIVAFGGLRFFDGGRAPGVNYFLWVWVPTLAIYLLYHPVVEVLMRGSTPGKRMAGVRIVTRTGDIPSASALLIRNVFRIVDSLPFAYLVGLTTAICTAQHVRIGDMAAGTLLILDSKEHDSTFARLSSANPALDPRAADLIHELLERWAALDARTRTDLARSLLSRVDGSLSSEQLAQLRTPELRARLQALLQ